MWFNDNNSTLQKKNLKSKTKMLGKIYLLILFIKNIFNENRQNDRMTDR